MRDVEYLDKWRNHILEGKLNMYFKEICVPKLIYIPIKSFLDFGGKGSEQNDSHV